MLDRPGEKDRSSMITDLFRPARLAEGLAAARGAAAGGWVGIEVAREPGPRDGGSVLSDALTRFFEGKERLFVRQRREWVEVLVDFETRNQYQVATEDGREIGVVAEEGGGFVDALRRWLLRSHRPLEIALVSPEASPLLRLSRKFFFLFSELAVSDDRGVHIGDVRRRFGILHRRYDLIGPGGLVFARVAGPRWRIWTFPISDAQGMEAGVISKKWGGALREVFSDADTFMIDYGGRPWSSEERAVLFAAAISIDFDFFENNQGRGGILGDFS